MATDQLPTNRLTVGDVELLTKAGEMIQSARALKDSPTKLRLELVEIQAARFEIGRRRSIMKGFARDIFAERYAKGKLDGLSPNASAKEAEQDGNYIEYKNAADLLDTAYDVMNAFVNVNQTSVRLATEESKNNL